MEKKRKSNTMPRTMPHHAVSGVQMPEPTDKERELIKLLKEFATDKEVLKAMNIKPRRLRELRASIKKKGLFGTAENYAAHYAAIGTTSSRVPPGRLRAHGFVISVPIHMGSEKYARQVQRRNGKEIDGNNLVLYPRGIKLYGAEGLSFYGDDVDAAMLEAHSYWRRIMAKIETQFGIVLFKAQGTEYAISCEVSDTLNGVAAKAKKERQNWLIRCEDTGKPIVKMDNSLKLFEFETAHFRTAAEDMQLWGAPLFNDYRKHGHVFRKPSEMWAAHDEVVGWLMLSAYTIHAHELRIHELEKAAIEKINKRGDELAKQLKETKRLRQELAKKVADSQGDPGELRKYTG